MITDRIFKHLLEQFVISLKLSPCVTVTLLIIKLKLIHLKNTAITGTLKPAQKVLINGTGG